MAEIATKLDRKMLPTVRVRADGSFVVDRASLHSSNAYQRQVEALASLVRDRVAAAASIDKGDKRRMK